MRKPLVAGNWKMNGSRESVETLAQGIKSGCGELAGSVEMAVFPPAVYLQQVAQILGETSVGWGVQNICTADSGAYTGETAASMAKDFSCAMILIGHSERRSLFGETDEEVAVKVQKTADAGLVPVLCVGETLEEREAGKTMEVVARQVKAVLGQVTKAALENLVVAYEPVWAIGTGLTATPEQAQEVHAATRELLAEHDAELAAKTRILYGGSVKSANAKEIFAQPDVDGGLVGGASLEAEEFLSICRSAG